MSREDLAAGDYVFLAFLLSGPMSAYDVKKAMAGSVSFFWTAAHSQVYQQAARLERDGFVRGKDAPGSRRKRLLSLTASGRRAVERWLAEPAESPRYYDESLVKLFFSMHSDRSATVAMLEDQRAKHRALLGEYETIHAQLAPYAEGTGPLMTLELGIAIERAWLAWAGGVLKALADSRRAPRSRKT